MPPGPHAGNRNRPAYSGQQRFRFPKPIIQLFAPRKAIEFKPPPRPRKLRRMTGLAGFISKFKETKGIVKKETKTESLFERPAQQRRRVREMKLKRVGEIVLERSEEWDPFKKEKVDGEVKTGDAFKTLFVHNIGYSTVEERVQEEFEVFGPVRRVVMPKDLQGVARGYGFVEFERERDLKVACREGNGLRIDGRRVVVDVERGRTVKGWRPNRLDGRNNSCVKKGGGERRDVRTTV